MSGEVSNFTWEKFLNEGLDGYFVARVVLSDGTEIPTKPSALWRQVEYRPPSFSGEFKLPAGLRASVIYSRHTYNFVRVWGNLPDLRLECKGSAEGCETQANFWVGFEDGSAGNILAFFLHSDHESTNKLMALVGRSKYWQVSSIDLFKPKGPNIINRIVGSVLGAPDPKHTFTIYIRRNLAAFEIDERIRHFVLFAPIDLKIKENTPPYGISAFPFMLKEDTFLLEMEVHPYSTKDRVVDIPPYGVRLGRAHDYAPLALPLYVNDSEDTLVGYSINKEEVISHPVPIYGFANSTIRFMSDRPGTANIEVYTLGGNWRTYDTISVPADKLVTYTMPGNALLARLTYAPSTYPARLLEGEAFMT